MHLKKFSSVKDGSQGILICSVLTDILVGEEMTQWERGSLFDELTLTNKTIFENEKE